MRLRNTHGIVVYICFFISLGAISGISLACDPQSYFLFQSEARDRLDSLSAAPSDDNAFERLILRHNLAFHNDKAQREKAEKLLETHFPQNKRSPLVRAYAGSLKMIKVSHRTMGSKVIRTINPFNKSPYAEGREGFRHISEAVALDSANTILRILRATAAAESAEHLNELFDSARIDLEWLQKQKNSTDSVCQFLVNLNWSKYYYKLAKRSNSQTEREMSQKHVELALDYACTPVYRKWADEWQSRIRELLIGDSKQK